MSPAQLLDMAQKAIEREGGAMVLTVPRARRPRGETAALVPGVNGRILAWDGARLTLYVKASDVLAWIARRASARPVVERQGVDPT